MSGSVPTHGAWRLLRGLTVGSVAFSLAIAGHVVGGGQAPPMLAAAVLALALGLGCVWLSDLRWTTPRLFAALAVAQVAFHGTLLLLTPAGIQASGPHSAMPAMEHGTAMLTPTMLLSHTGSVMVTALILSRGEQWVWGLARLLSSWLPRIVVPTRSPAAAVDVASLHPHVLPALHGLLIACWRSRRGPPPVLAS